MCLVEGSHIQGQEWRIKNAEDIVFGDHPRVTFSSEEWQTKTLAKKSKRAETQRRRDDSTYGQALRQLKGERKNTCGVERATHPGQAWSPFPAFQGDPEDSGRDWGGDGADQGREREIWQTHRSVRGRCLEAEEGVRCRPDQEDREGRMSASCSGDGTRSFQHADVPRVRFCESRWQQLLNTAVHNKPWLSATSIHTEY